MDYTNYNEYINSLIPVSKKYKNKDNIIKGGAVMYKEKQETDISQLSNDKLTKNQLIIKLQKTEENIKTLEIKVKELEKLLNKE